MKIAYVRSSFLEQNINKQIDVLKKYNIDKWFKDSLLENDFSYKELKEMLSLIKRGDMIYVTELGKLAKTTSDLISVIKTIEKKRATLMSIKENIDSSTAEGQIKISMIQIMSNFERNSLLERQKEGVENAKREGKSIGRQPVKVDKELFNKTYDEYMSRKLTKLQFAEKVGVTRPTLDKFIKAYETNTIAEDDNFYFVETKRKN